MGLEKLKSVFKEGFEEKSSTTNLADMVSEFGTPIDELFNLNANTLIDTGGWTSLYNPDHTAKEDVGYLYPNVSRDNLNIRYQNSGQIGTEPFIVSNILSHLGGSRDFPIKRAINDTLRISKYLKSSDGLAFIAKQNALGLLSNVESEMSVAGMSGKISTPQKHARGYSPLATLAAVGSRLVGPQPNILYRKDWPFGMSKYPATVEIGGVDISLGYRIEDTFRGGGLIGGSIKGIGAKVRNPLKKSGDKMTLASMIQGHNLLSVGTTTTTMDTETGVYGIANVNIESKKNGMPFYFKDLRDNTYILFRAYVESITENISPSWSSTNYIGRSEPVYVYERSERDVSFTLKLFAHTPNELDSIYEKIDRLTSMCYPSYVKDENLNGKSRMKPPLLKFRLGELFGSRNNEMLGFLKSCAYSYPDSSPWETEVGKRVPKHITVSLTYQVIHMEVPSLDFVLEDSKNSFYGINQNAVTVADKLKAGAMDLGTNIVGSAIKGLTGR